MKHTPKKGFTLIELLVVIVLLGFLITAGLGSFVSSLKKSRDSRRKSDLRQMATALEAYYNDKGNFPKDHADGSIWGCGTAATPAKCAWGAKWYDSVANTVYMVALGQDPLPIQHYYYTSDANGTYYKLYALLENTKDDDRGTILSGYSGTVCRDTTPATTCTFGISSADTTP